VKHVRVVCITGASGFLGHYVCRAFLARGVSVRGIVRRGTTPDGVERICIPDVTDRDAVRRAVLGAEAVIHLAARAHVMHEVAADPLSEFRRTNVTGTRAVFEEALRAGAARLVFVSSVKAVAESSSEPLTEDATPHPSDPYGTSKLEAERLVENLPGIDAVSVSILRPPLMYGRSVGGNFLRLLQWLDRRVPLPFGAVSNSRSLAFAGNVAAAIEAVVLRGRVGCQTYFVTDGADVSTPELLRRLADLMGRPARLVPVPLATLRLAARIGDVFPRRFPVPFTSDAINRLSNSLTLDARKLERDIGFVPPFSLTDGLRETVAWFLRTR